MPPEFLFRGEICDRFSKEHNVQRVNVFDFYDQVYQYAHDIGYNHIKPIISTRVHNLEVTVNESDNCDLEAQGRVFANLLLKNLPKEVIKGIKDTLLKE